MLPICLNGHSRPITQIKYNHDGDLLFTISKSNTCNVWYAVNGERLGDYKGHNGAVWCCDVDWTTSKLMTGSADNSLLIYDVETGTQQHSIGTKTAVRSCGWSYSGNLIFLSTDKTMGNHCELVIFDIRDADQMRNAATMLKTGAKNVAENGHSASHCVLRTILPSDHKITAAVWAPLEHGIITGHDTGAIGYYNLAKGSGAPPDKLVHAHTGMITDIQLSHDETMFITSSKDSTAKLHGSYNLDSVKTYRSDRPVNSASISPLKDHVLLGGGQEAMDVTTTAVTAGKFDATFYHMIYEEEIGTVKGHFGPINSVSFTRNGRGFATGGEDGYVRLHEFDSTYMDFDCE